MRNLLSYLLILSLCSAQEVEIEEARRVVKEEVKPRLEDKLENGDFDIFGQQESDKDEAPNFFEFLPQLPEEIEVTSQSTTYVSETKTLHFSKDVVIKGDNGLIIYADEASVDTKNKKVTAHGDVSVFNGPLLYHGNEATYHYESKKIETNQVRTSHDPFYIEAGSIRTIESTEGPVQLLENARLTTDDFQAPSYWVKADKIAIHPDDTIVLKHLKVQVGGKTVLWLPYVAHSLDSDLGYHFNVGFESHQGAFIKNRYGIYLGGERDPETLKVVDPEYLLNFHLDGYFNRGVGLGLSFKDLDFRETPELGNYSFYWIYDADPSIERTSVDRSDFDDNNRYKFEIQDRRNLPDFYGGKTRVDTRLALISDQFFLEDYEEKRFAVDPEPENTIFLTHTRERSVSTLATRFQVNSFYETDTRFPELSYEQVRSKLWDTPFLYEGQSRVGFLQRSISDDQRELFRDDLNATNDPETQNLLEQILDEDPYFRAHTWHELSLPLTPKAGVSFTPRAGLGYTHYIENSNNINDGRLIGQLGLDISAKFSRDYKDIRSQSLGLNGIGHRIQPYINLSYIETSDPELGNLQLVDTLTPITRPRPVNAGRISAIDELTDQFTIRNGLRQSLFTKRNGAAHEWLYLDTFIDFVPTTSTGDNRFSNLYNELKWVPLPWFSFNLESQIPIGDSADNFQEVLLSSSFLIGKSTTVSVGFQFLENHPVVSDIAQLNYDIYHRINDKWGVGINHNWRLDNDILSRQSYTISHNLKSWVFSAGIFRRDFVVDAEWGATIGLTLRDFPEISLPISVGGNRN